jgi:hypothetical protein
VRTPQPATRSVTTLTGPLVVGVVAGITPATAAATQTRSSGLAASFITGALSGVAATSAGNAWAVGSAGNGKTLIVAAAWADAGTPCSARIAGIHIDVGGRRPCC